MKIKERIITLIEEQKDEKSANLWNICQKIIDNINAHNKQIIAQMQEYDTHDQEHSEKVLEIMENILDPTTIEKMSFYELILLYMSAYLHDSAMAMPNWEYTLLRAVEGTEEYNDSTLSFKICNDYKRVHTFSEALDMVQNNKDKLFDYEKARQYVCMKPTEEALIESLAELMCSHEEFRNGYTEELDGCKDSVSKYMNKSKFIRSEFIRQTHHIRVVDNVYALKGKIADAIGGFYAESFVEDLAAVCRCHGEKLEKIFELPIARKDWSDENANIQFLAILLRLGDVIHFDSERAPMSLYAEKQISDAESYKHWNAKFQELQYTVHNENSKVSIRYQAYCREPEMYYFIQDYLDGIDNEIDNYYILKNRWELIQNRELERYYLNIDKVDRTQIKYDRDRFVPDKNMKFVLNQSKILELLMGIQLYKDKFLCIREIYQNALDASKCMKAYNRKLGKTENLTIQFGVGVEEIQGKTEKYIYCLDHGTGMNEYIIRNYLLHIGNSYYRSKEFAKKNTDWGYDVNPTSQFGIGLLSGYMLADKIGITTIHYEDNKALSFVLEGANEHFYYIKPNRLEKEQIGEHGTLIKLYLKSEYCDNINAKYIPKLPLALMTSRSEIKNYVGERSLIDGNLLYILSQHIGIKCADIPVRVCDEEGKCHELYYSNTIFDQRNYDEIHDEDVEQLWKERHYLGGGENPYKLAIEKRNLMDDYVIKAVSENVELYSHITLPKRGIGEYNVRLFDFGDFLGNKESSIFVDGVLVETSMRNCSEIEDVLGEDIVMHSMLNYVGNKRPVLSVDRNSCVEMPKIKEELKNLRDAFVGEILDTITGHVQKENITGDDPEGAVILNIVIREFPTLSGCLLKRLCASQNIKLTFDKKFLENHSYNMNDIFSKDTIVLSETNFMEYQEITRQVILGRSMYAEKIKVNDLTVEIRGGEYQEFPDIKHAYRHENLSLVSVAIGADEWEGVYKEYDLVSRLWPIVSTKLYDSLVDEYSVSEVTKRCKTISEVTNGMQGIANLDPVLIHPRYGISSKSQNHLRKRNCYVGEFESIQKQYWLFEMTNHGELTREKKISYALYAYIGPRKLNEMEQERLDELAESDPEYVQGVKEGWSILFLGAIEKYIICPGVMPRDEIVKKIPDSYKKMKPDITYLFTDGSHVFDEFHLSE